jgi:nitrate reductase / nitrite oxidoreductase, beta subunit
MGQPTICSETCVGRLRYLGLMLYDADAVLPAAATADPKDLYEAQLSVFLDPDDPVVAAEAAKQGIPSDWMDAARRSPIHALAVKHKVALPLHPEYRTLPMVWYIPPLSPVADLVHADGYDESDPDQVFAKIDALRIPVEYLANLFTAGDPEPVRRVLRRLAAVRAVMRAGQLGLTPPEGLAEAAGGSEAGLEDLYRLLAIAKYDDRYVIPQAHAEDAGRLMSQHEQLFCSLDTDGGPGMGGHGPPGEPSGESFHPASQPGGSHLFQGGDGRTHFNLLGWDGSGSAPNLFPEGGPS